MGKHQLPVHVAIIMDGNGRWAKRHGVSRSEGHRKGMLVLKETIKNSILLGVKFLTVYAFSTENWKRSENEVSFLMQMCESVIAKELAYMIQNDICFRHIGRLEGLPETLQSAIRRAEDLTHNNKKLFFQLAFNYGSRLEIMEMVKKISGDIAKGNLAPADISESLVDQNLYTQGLPDPDLLIRTSGEMRISNFLLWQLAYAEIYVTKKYWPDFNKREFVRAIGAYQKRTRRFGGYDAQS